jgi:hypothetical protein
MTLIEVLVAGAVFLFVLGVVAHSLAPGVRAWLRGDRKSDAQQNAIVVISRIGQEIQHAHPDSISVSHEEAADHSERSQDSVMFLSCTDPQGRVNLSVDGDPIWQRRVAYYLDDAGQLRSVDMPLDTPTTDPRPVLATRFDRSQSDRIVARHVTSLALAYTAPLLRIQVETTVEDQDTRLESLVSPVYNTLTPPAPTPSPSPSP